MFKSCLTFLMTIALFLLLVGCRATPAPDSGFLQDPKLMRADKDVAFNRLYVNPKFKDTQFINIYVAPVNTDYVMAQNIWERATLASVSKEDVKKNVALLAEYMRNAFVKEFRNDPKKRFTVVDEPG